MAISLALGFGLPGLFSPLAHSSQFRSGVVIFVMLLMGWTLQPRAVVRSARQPASSLLAIGINVFGVPLLAWPTLWILPPDLAGGLIVASLVPCTLASATVWTRAAGGDDAVAMVTTVVTNLLCFVVAPVGLWLILGRVAETDVTGQMKGLFLQVVAPLIAGQTLRRLGFDVWGDRNKVPLSNVAQVGILVMVLLGSVLSAERLPPDSSQTVVMLLLTTCLAAVIHIAAVAMGYFASGSLGAETPQQRAVAISCGQKTLMVGLQLALDTGVSVIPMIIYHIGQLLLDTLLVKHWLRRDQIARATTEAKQASDLKHEPE